MKHSLMNDIDVNNGDCFDIDGWWMNSGGGPVDDGGGGGDIRDIWYYGLVMVMPNI